MSSDSEPITITGVIYGHQEDGVLLTQEAQIGQVGRLEVHHGDVLVVMVPENLSERQLRAIGAGLVRVLPADVKIVLSEHSLEFFALGMPVGRQPEDKAETGMDGMDATDAAGRGGVG